MHRGEENRIKPLRQQLEVKPFLLFGLSVSDSVLLICSAIVYQDAIKVVAERRRQRGKHSEVLSFDGWTIFICTRDLLCGSLSHSLFCLSSLSALALSRSLSLSLSIALSLSRCVHKRLHSMQTYQRTRAHARM